MSCDASAQGCYQTDCTKEGLGLSSKGGKGKLYKHNLLACLAYLDGVLCRHFKGVTTSQSWQDVTVLQSLSLSLPHSIDSKIKSSLFQKNDRVNKKFKYYLLSSTL